MAKNELSPELRVLLACGLSMLVLLLARPLLVRSPAPGSASSNQPAATTPSTPAASTAPPTAPKTPVTAAVSPNAASASQASSRNSAVPSQTVQADAEEKIVVEGSLYRVIFSNRGAGVESWTLTKYNDNQGHPLELVNSAEAAQYGNPLSVWTDDEQVREQVNTALFVSSVHGTVRAPVTLDFTYNNDGVAAHKRFAFNPDSYVVGVESDLASSGKPVDSQLEWRGSFGDIHDFGFRGTGWSVFYRDPNKLNVLAPKNAQGASKTMSGVFALAGIEDRFFCAAFLPLEASAQGAMVPVAGMRVNAFKDHVTLPGQTAATDSVGVAAGSDNPQNALRFFVGPKQDIILRDANPLLPEVINYGWFSFMAKPLLVALRWIYDHIVGNYGWAIILLTVAITMALFPLRASSMRSARKMQQIQPQLKAIQDKYKGLKVRDPKRSQMGQETMDLYKKHGVNPMGACLPMFLQLPFLYAFYEVLLLSIEMRQAPWISWWVPDLSAPEPHWIKVLPLLMCVSQFAMQRLTPTPSADPTQQKMMMLMPVMFLVFFYYLSSGLVLYYLTSNVVSALQQVYIDHTEAKQRIEERRSAAERKKRPVRQT